MSPEVVAAIITAAVSLVAATFAAYSAVASQARIKQLEDDSREKAESAAFIAAKLNELYIPVSMNLAATKKLYDRFFDANEEEKKAIEHEFRQHNAVIRQRLMTSAMYLEPDVPDDMIDALLEHLIQWEIVYKLKYEYKVYDGPVFAGIKEFGFRGFPQDTDPDGYFRKKMEELRGRHHRRLSRSSREMRFPEKSASID